MNVSYSPLRLVNDRNKSNNGADQPPAVSIPLLMNSSAPMAKSEIDDDLDDREVVTDPYPGVDDGFFENKNKDVPPDVEKIDSNEPKIPDIMLIPSTPDIEIPSITPRFGEDDASNGGPVAVPDEIDGDNKNRPVEGRTLFATPFKPPFGHDLEGGSAFGDSDIPDVNIYQHKKTLAQGMMDLALFSANANQLRYVVESGHHPYFYPSVILISFSLLVQVAVGIGLIWNATYSVKDDKEMCKANKINNFTVIGIFLVTVVNVFISAFGVASPAATPVQP